MRKLAYQNLRPFFLNPFHILCPCKNTLLHTYSKIQVITFFLVKPIVLSFLVRPWLDPTFFPFFSLESWLGNCSVQTMNWKVSRRSSSNFPKGGFGPLSLIFDLRKKDLVMVPWETHTYRATFMAFLPTQKHDKELKGRKGSTETKWGQNGRDSVLSLGFTWYTRQ